MKHWRKEFQVFNRFRRIGFPSVFPVYSVGNLSLWIVPALDARLLDPGLHGLGLNHGAEFCHHRREALGDLTERADFDRMQQLGENIRPGAGHVLEALEGGGCAPGMFLPEGANALDLRALTVAGRLGQWYL